MSRLTIALLWCALLACSGSAAWAQSNSNVRGTITAFDGKAIAVATREGKSVEVLLPDTLNGSGIKAFTLDYREGTVKVLVPPGTPMSQSVPGSRADLKAGETVFIVARQDADGKLTALRVQVSTNGVKPTQ